MMTRYGIDYMTYYDYCFGYDHKDALDWSKIKSQLVYEYRAKHCLNTCIYLPKNMVYEGLAIKLFC